jgi:drug/metabolite transporter (DMT)-like permease
MRRALLAGALLGVIVGLVFVNHDTLRLSVAWPIILGIALWEVIGDRGSRGVVAGAAAIVGAFVGWVAFAIVAYYMPTTDLSLGIVTGVAVGLIVAAGVILGERFSLTGMLIGFGAFFGIFQPLWNQSPGNFRIHGFENLTVVWLGLLLGILSTAVVRAVTEGVRVRMKERTVQLPESEAPEAPPTTTTTTTPLSEMLEGGAGE